MGMTIDVGELLKAMDTWDKFGSDPNEGLIPLRTPALQDRYVPYVKYDDMVNCVKGMPSVEAIPKDQYEQRLKTDLVAILTEIQLEIEEWTEVNQEERMRCEKEGSPILETIGFDNGITTINRLIQQKINSLKEA